MYIRIAFFIELRLRVSRSLRSLANHPSSNTLISKEQRGGVRNKYIYIYIYIYIYMYIRIAFFIELRLRVSRSLRSLANHPSLNTLISTEQGGGVHNKYVYLITLMPRNITSQLQCISASATDTSALW